ncbi:Uncharacterised protein [Vibrio cholerae]|nr:Uncharacterised protein [Vibrio cholerae]
MVRKTRWIARMQKQNKGVKRSPRHVVLPSS